MNTLALIKKIETIQGKITALAQSMGKDYGLHCQTIGRELNQLQKKLESGEIKLHK